jgi:4-hydroxybenzoate polyprenyltransferase
MPQAVLGVAFSFGIPMAFAAVLGGPDATWPPWPPPCRWARLGLLLGNLFWVLAYDTEYAMVDRDDDLRIGMKTSAITLGRFDVAAVMGFYAAYLLSWAAWAGHWAWAGCLLIGMAVAAAQAVWHYTLIRDRSATGCFRPSARTTGWAFAVFAGVASAPAASTCES